jgi:hypothetical protein
LLAFLLRHDRSYRTGKHWTQRNHCWLAGLTFQEQAHGIVIHDYLEAVWTGANRFQLQSRLTSSPLPQPRPRVEAQKSAHISQANQESDFRRQQKAIEPNDGFVNFEKYHVERPSQRTVYGS